jgi:hypothetical protein
MFGRMLAFAIALSVGATGVLPTGDAYRCVAMNKRMAPGDDCCPKCNATPMSVGTPCCELVIHGRLLDSRAPSSLVQLRLAPSPVTGILAPAPVSLIAAAIGRHSISALPRGRPPGEQLERFSAVLRI